MTKQGIIIANTGSPTTPTPDAVRSYLSEFLTDPRICPINPVVWKLILNAFILPMRSRTSAEKYQRIWTEQGSPLLAGMASLASKLEAELNDTPVRVAMSYGNPSMTEALKELRNDGCDQLVVIPLYPQGAFSTTKVVEDKLHDALEALDWNPDLRFIEGYSDHDLYLDAIAASVRNAGFTDGDALLMTFHSIPMKDVNAGDVYADLANETARAVAARLGLGQERWRIGFQSRFDSRAWVGPFTAEAVGQLQLNDSRLFVVAPNFSIDCLETFYDINEVKCREWAQSAGSTRSDAFVYVPCLNDSDAHVALLKALIEKDGEK